MRLEDIEKSEKDHDDKPLKEVKRYLKVSKKELVNRLSKLKQYDEQSVILKNRNSYSKTDNDATFMRVKEDHMKNGQLKPAYNLQLATSNQFIIACELFQNPTDTRTLIPFSEKINTDKARQLTIVADSGYGYESNYEYIANQDNLIGIIPYNTMLKENSKKWRTDDSKGMNWGYDELSDVYTDNVGVHFSFYRYVERQDDYGFTRQFKEYRTETKDNDGITIPAALTKSGYVRKITINPNWEWHKANQRKLMKDYAHVYSQRKIDVEPVFGKLKTTLVFTRFIRRGLFKNKVDISLVALATNFLKLRSLQQAIDI